MRYTDKIIFTLAIVLPACVALVFLLKLALYSRRVKMQVAEGSMIGLIGQAKTDIAESGLVMVRGELWHAHSSERIALGSRVRVVGYQKLTLVVKVLKAGEA